jgi:hypothetical protein
MDQRFYYLVDEDGNADVYDRETYQPENRTGHWCIAASLTEDQARRMVDASNAHGTPMPWVR